MIEINFWGLLAIIFVGYLLLKRLDDKAKRHDRMMKNESD